MPTSRFALHGLAPLQFTVCAPFLPLIHGLCAFFRLLLTPVSAAPSLPASQFTVCTSRFTRLRIFGLRMCLMFLSFALDTCRGVLRDTIATALALWNCCGSQAPSSQWFKDAGLCWVSAASATNFSWDS